MAHWFCELAQSVLRVPLPQREPFAHGKVAKALDLDWDGLDAILAREPDVLFVKNGRRLAQTSASTEELLARGIGYVVRRAEAHHAQVRALCAALAPTATAQIFVTAAGTHGFGWHYAAEDVFILQLAGTKEYAFRRNTVAQAVRAPLPEDLQLERETSPVMRCTVSAPGFVHIPLGVWHVARCLEASLSLSVGVSPPQEEPQSK